MEVSLSEPRQGEKLSGGVSQEPDLSQGVGIYMPTPCVRLPYTDSYGICTNSDRNGPDSKKGRSFPFILY